MSQRLSIRKSIGESLQYIPVYSVCTLSVLCLSYIIEYITKYRPYSRQIVVTEVDSADLPNGLEQSGHPTDHSLQLLGDVLDLTQRWFNTSIADNNCKLMPNPKNLWNKSKLYTRTNNLLFILLLLGDGVELQLVLVLLDRNESDPVSKLVLLQESLGQVLQVLTGELGSGDNNNLVTLLSDGDFLTQVTDDTVNLDVFNQVLNVSLLVENSVLNWSRSVNDKLLSSLSVLGGLDSLLAYRTFITIHTW